MKRRNFLASLGLVAGVTAVVKADKQSDSFIKVKGKEVMRITSSGNIGICTGGSSLPKKLNVVGVIGNTPS